MGSYRSKEDDVSRISTSIFVTNFPDSFSAKDLFHSCKQYGHVVDLFIPLKRSKEGKRFSFVRFINVFNVKRLKKKDVGTNRSGTNAPCKDVGITGTCKSFVHVVKSNNMFGSTESDSIPAIVVDDECLYSKDLSKSLLGRVKEFATLSNLKTALTNEGFIDIIIRYMGELWVLLEIASTKSKELFRDNVWVGSRFFVLRQASTDFTPKGRIVWVEEEMCFHSKRLCLYTKFHLNIFENFKIIFRGKVFWIRAKEVPGWVSELLEESDDDDHSDDGFKEGDPKAHNAGSCGDDSDLAEVSKTLFDESTRQKEKHSEDPFGVYPLLNKNNKEKPEIVNDDDHSLQYPSGFTPNVVTNEFVMNEENGRSVNGDSLQNCNVGEVQIGRDGDSANKGSKGIVDGSSMNFLSLNIQGLAQKAKKDWVKELCVKNKVNFLALQETKMECIELFIVKRCWGNFAFDYVHSDSVGDNEVRYKSDRFGSIFNAQGAYAFNLFIANAGLEKVHLGGSAFTWCHKSATKMSKLDSMMRKLEFLKVKIREWINGNMNNTKGLIDRYKEELQTLDAIIDKDNGSDEVVNKRVEVINSIQCRFSLTGFPAQSIRSSNAIALDSPYLLVLITGTSQSSNTVTSESDSYYLSDLSRQFIYWTKIDIQLTQV
nr:nucleotide-binding alpha-beta plait domain-containing protein [Tanacetum cinerariifolium]